MKVGLIDDALTIVDVEGLLKGDEDQIGGFSLICQNGVDYDKKGFEK